MTAKTTASGVPFDAQGELAPVLALVLKNAAGKSVDELVRNNEGITTTGGEGFGHGVVPDGGAAEALLLRGKSRRPSSWAIPERPARAGCG